MALVGASVIRAEWQLNIFCNFNCSYCYFTQKDRTNPRLVGYSDVDAWVKAFDQTGRVWQIGITGGEPFLHPRFVELCKKLTQKHTIDITTNLSTNNINTFCEGVDPAKVTSINASLHIQERERLRSKDDFAKNFHCLKENGFKVRVSQVMFPSILGRFSDIFNEFQKRGIIIRPKMFKGDYLGKSYPGGYSEDEKKLILSFDQKTDELEKPDWLLIKVRRPGGSRFTNFQCNKETLDGYLSFQGIPCAAGKEFVIIRFNGDVLRCDDDPRYLGNLLKGDLRFMRGTEACGGRICSCPHYGLALAGGNPDVISAARLRHGIFFGKIKAILKNATKFKFFSPWRY